MPFLPPKQQRQSAEEILKHSLQLQQHPFPMSPVVDQETMRPVGRSFINTVLTDLLNTQKQNILSYNFMLNAGYFQEISENISQSINLTGVAVSSDRGLSLPEMTAIAAASDSIAPRLAARSSAIFMNRSAAAVGTEFRDLKQTVTHNSQLKQSSVGGQSLMVLSH